ERLKVSQVRQRLPTFQLSATVHVNTKFSRFAYDSLKITPAKKFGQYVNTTEATFDSRKLEPANNCKFSALARFAKT
ncbi:MAG: hypothetical protein PV344_06785, partial [Anaplasma sp.]|nr:hypothetical protein [Anaplasma sp.]